ncbi:hypothetical protein EXS71_01730 [Candidatus Uhrbacteria bacterium]|nr:hypothetical protein [Candidatus Uhrbacteria bacterium]
MKLFFLRILPWIVGALGLFLSAWQWVHPLSYPWPLIIFSLSYLVSAVALVWKQLSWKDASDKLVPPFLALTILCFAFLLVQNVYEKWIVTFLLAGISFFALELTFLFTRAPSRYPVNGLSRFNIALIPLMAFFLAATLNGLEVFLRLPWWIFGCAFLVFGASAFFFTAHPTAKFKHRSQWTFLGVLVGLQTAILGLVLPVSMLVHGALAAFFFLFPLRIRRYAYPPVPSWRTAWSEGLLAVIFFIGILITTRWV